MSSSAPLSISLIIASFGSSTPYHNHAFDLVLDLDPSSRIAAAGEKPTRYGKLIEIHHTFKEDPRSPPKIITLIFTAAVVTTLPILAITVKKSFHFPPFHFCLNKGDSLIQGGVNRLVALSRRESQPSAESVWKVTHLSLTLLQLHNRHGGCLLLILHLLEPIPDSTRHSYHWLSNVFKRQQSPEGSAGAKTIRLAVKGQKFFKHHYDPLDLQGTITF